MERGATRLAASGARDRSAETGGPRHGNQALPGLNHARYDDGTPHGRTSCRIKCRSNSLIARAAEDPKGLARLAAVFFNLGDEARAHEIALRALKAAPDDAEIRSLASRVIGKGIPAWHFTIVRDQARNAAYEAALKRAVNAQTRVLEVGAGSAILAMMAARAGAKDVVTCEMVAAVAEAAEEIVALNGFADRVRVVAKKSYDLDPERDMGGLADVLVSEIVDNRMLGEDTLAVTEHAVQCLLKPGGKVIPARGVVRVALARDDEIGRFRMGTVDGFDLSPFDRLAPISYRIPRGNSRLTLTSAAADLFDFDFRSGGPFPAASASTTVTSAGGEANGIAQWIALQLDAEVRYENGPLPGTSSAWAVMFWPFAAPRDYPAGTAVEIAGQHDRKSLQIWA